MSEEAKWYVVHTYSGYENKVATNLETIVENRKLQDWIHEIRVPTETVVEIKDNKKREVERKIFPGYVLVKMVMTDDSWYVVRNTRGCTGFVGPNGKPIPLTEEEVTALGVEKREIEVNYTVGDTSSITCGSLVNIESRNRPEKRTRFALPSPCSAGKPRWNWSWIRRNGWIKASVAKPLPGGRSAPGRTSGCGRSGSLPLRHLPRFLEVQVKNGSESNRLY